jgi:hypothetical protein
MKSKKQTWKLTDIELTEIYNSMSAIVMQREELAKLDKPEYKELLADPSTDILRDLIKRMGNALPKDK